MLTDYHNYTQLVSELESLAESYPHLSRIYSVGNSTENRELMVIQISEGVTEVKIYLAFSLVQLLHYWALIGRELQSLEIFQYVPMPALLCHKEQAQETKAPDMVGFRTKYPHWHLWVFLAFQWFFMV